MRIAWLLALSLWTATSAFQGTLAFDVPDGWLTKAPSSSMRVAEFQLPPVDGDLEAAELVVYYFGGGGGSVEANIERWLGQIEQPDGRASRDAASTRTIAAHELSITLLDVSGTFVAEITPGRTERHHKPGFRLQAGYVETPAGPYFVKLTGPVRTVTRWEESLESFLESLRFEP